MAVPGEEAVVLVCVGGGLFKREREKKSKVHCLHVPRAMARQRKGCNEGRNDPRDR